jgi:hypothetical protein
LHFQTNFARVASESLVAIRMTSKHFTFKHIASALFNSHSTTIGSLRFPIASPPSSHADKLKRGGVQRNTVFSVFCERVMQSKPIIWEKWF